MPENIWETFRSAWRPLLKLEEAWRSEQPRRERGGRVALMGFRYQIHIYLLEAVRAEIGEAALTANVELLKQNAELAARLAVALGDDDI